MGTISRNAALRHFISEGKYVDSGEICNKFFRNQGAKKTHMKTHEAERGIKCAICGKTCLDQVGLRSHQTKNAKCLEMAANMQSQD